ncbi:MAG: butyrate kinase [Chloroflexota bacterium]
MGIGMKPRILVINPGSTSTKVAAYEDERQLFLESVRHSAEELSRYATMADQYPARRDAILSFLAQRGFALGSLSAVVGRGGILHPLASGTFRIDENMIAELREPNNIDHASNLGAPLAYEIAGQAGVPAFTVDPVAVDEFDDIARISGLPEIPRLSISHALNIKAVARHAAGDLGRDYADLNLVVVHLGGGISVTAHRRGRMVDVNNAAQAGPFSPERTGTLPLQAFADLCFSGRYTLREIKRLVMGNGGLVAHLRTNDTLEVERMIAAGDAHALLIYEAMAYTVAKEIGAMATVLAGDVDAIVLTGGIAHSQMLVGWIEQRVKFIAKVRVYPGEFEMLALAQGTLRVLRGEEEAKTYRG